MGTVYFDSSVFLSVLNGDETAKEVKSLLLDLQREKTRIYTSIITIQEVSVDCYKDGTPFRDNYAAVKRLARIEGVTRDVALTAAKIEAQVIDQYESKEEKASDSKRRKWDCFHIATAQHLKCTHLYTFDDKMLKKGARLRVKNVEFSKPTPRNPGLFDLE